MTLEPSAWRANDSVAYDAARDAANTATAMLFDRVDVGTVELADAVSEAAAIRREVLRIDGFDRAAVDDLARRLSDRIAELSELRP